MENKWFITSVILGVFLLLTVGYLAVTQYNQFQRQQQTTAFQEGAQAGFQRAVVQVIQQSRNCEPVPLNAGNTTVNVVAVECLEQARQQGSQVGDTN